MEQHRTRPARYGPRRDRPPRPPLPPQAGRAPGGGVARSARPAARPAPDRQVPDRQVPDRPARARRPAPPAARHLPNPRLTGLGGGLFCGFVMLTLGFLVALLFGSVQTVYGALFLPVCVLTALWVREGDLLTAPVIVPIAFALGLLPLVDDGGSGGWLMGMVTGLATQAGWLYGGTLVAGAIVLGRRMRTIRVLNRRAAAARSRLRA
ncbi:DUF6542 domain-containing protein [Streptomyces sp. NPDC050388]|uniref:DUF6542 domain-containing protein n=1 Tax=Streptomyces sp. NPDC050388 TaxID=3155781 RepID=UPI00341D46B5